MKKLIKEYPYFYLYIDTETGIRSTVLKADMHKENTKTTKSKWERNNKEV